MMLRSSSTPILGSLLSSYSESPNHNHHSDFSSPKHPPKKLSFHQTCPLNLITPSSYSVNSSPTVSAAEFSSDDRHSSRTNGFRRVQSDGNLEGLVSSCNSFDEFSNSIPTKKFPRKPNCSVLQTIPSFTVYNARNRYEDDDYEDEEEEEEEEEEETDEADEAKSGDVSLEQSMAYMKVKGLDSRSLVVQQDKENIPSKMHLATGLGVVGGGFGGSGGYNEYKPLGFGGDSSGGGGGGTEMEEFYQKMMMENPGNPLFLRNYAQFLHQTKKDLEGAEHYYSRAILMDPGDGEILSQYAQLTWELHRNEERASSYFQRAVQAAPEDSHVLAAYAGFLWETEDEADNDMPSTNLSFRLESIATAATV